MPVRDNYENLPKHQWNNDELELSLAREFTAAIRERPDEMKSWTVKHYEAPDQAARIAVMQRALDPAAAQPEPDGIVEPPKRVERGGRFPQKASS